jgi:hypothetical protein
MLDRLAHATEQRLLTGESAPSALDVAVRFNQMTLRFLIQPELNLNSWLVHRDQNSSVENVN